ncbi:MAG: hypothetical protein KGI38_09170 [Thaumarchaeota archaeon]|nr:hypothetical protein [Nitrososphaerota archaeon]
MNISKKNAFASSAITLLLVLTFFAATTPVAKAAGPCGETAYANGQLFCINLTKIITNPSAGLLASSEPLYIAAYFTSSTPTTTIGGFVLPTAQLGGCDITNPSSCGPELVGSSGYKPLCNPCFHGGFLNNFPYHDHVISGAPGSGNDGTAGVMKGPWVLILVAYNPSYTTQPGFTPFKSTADITAGETAGDFLAINPSAANPYEINTGIVVIFGVQPVS